MASSLKTVSARAIITAMVNDETDARSLAEMAKGRVRSKIPDLAQALEATSMSTTPSWLDPPGIYESAGKRTAAGRRRRNKWLTAMLVDAAGSVGRMHGKNYLAVQHARLTRRRGMSRAQFAVAHSILTTVYYMLKRDEPYKDLGTEWLAKRNEEAHTRRLVAQLAKLGHTEVIDPRNLRTNCQLHRRTPSDGAHAPWGRSFTGMCGPVPPSDGEGRCHRVCGAGNHVTPSKASLSEGV